MGNTDPRAREETVVQRARANASAASRWELDGRHVALVDTTLKARGVDVDLESVESVQVSRYQRVQPRGWWRRLLGRPGQLVDTIQIQMRTSTAELRRLEAVCDDPSLLDVLPWLDVGGLRVPFDALCSVLSKLIDCQARLVLGTPNERPSHLDLSRQVTRAGAHVLELVEGTPGDRPWTRLCEVLDACSDDEIVRVRPLLERRLQRWDASLRPPPERWWRCLADGRADPRLHLAAPLDALDLSDGDLSIESVEAIAGTSSLRSLEILDLSLTKIGPDAAERIAQADHLRSLRALDLGFNHIGDRGVRALAQASHLSGLETLNLSSNELTERSALHLAESPHLTSLVGLHLDRNAIGSDGVTALVRSDNMRTVRTLGLAHNEIGPGGLADLAACPSLDALESLDLSHNEIGPGGAAALAQATNLPRLQSLHLRGNGIGSDGAVALANSKHLGALETLNLADNDIGPEGVAAIAKSTRLPKLYSLDLSGVRSDGALSLAESSGLPSLGELTLDGSELDSGALERLEQWCRERDIYMGF